MAFDVPDWAQKTLAAAAGMEMELPMVRVDNSDFLIFIDLHDRAEYHLSKSTGKVTKLTEGKEPVRGYQRKRPGEGHEGFL